MSQVQVQLCTDLHLLGECKLEVDHKNYEQTSFLSFCFLYICFLNKAGHTVLKKIMNLSLPVEGVECPFYRADQAAG